VLGGDVGRVASPRVHGVRWRDRPKLAAALRFAERRLKHGGVGGVGVRAAVLGGDVKPVASPRVHGVRRRDRPKLAAALRFAERRLKHGPSRIPSVLGAARRSKSPSRRLAMRRRPPTPPPLIDIAIIRAKRDTEIITEVARRVAGLAQRRATSAGLPKAVYLLATRAVAGASRTALAIGSSFAMAPAATSLPKPRTTMAGAAVSTRGCVGSAFRASASARPEPCKAMAGAGAFTSGWVGSEARTGAARAAATAAAAIRNPFFMTFLLGSRLLRSMLPANDALSAIDLDQERTTPPEV
jgi:hypothetical protein